jgi:hypothetical protein
MEPDAAAVRRETCAGKRQHLDRAVDAGNHRTRIASQHPLRQCAKASPEIEQGEHSLARPAHELGQRRQLVSATWNDAVRVLDEIGDLSPIAPSAKCIFVRDFAPQI